MMATLLTPWLPLLAFVLIFAAWVLVAASMERHRKELPGAAPGQTLLWRGAGYGLGLLALWPCLLRWDVSVALAAWTALLGFAAMALGLVLTYFPARAQHLTRGPRALVRRLARVQS